MGGRVFGENSCDRLQSKEDFENAVFEIRKCVYHHDFEMKPVLSYEAKSTFGDIDILFSNKSKNLNAVDTLCDILESCPECKKISRNTSIISVLWQYKDTLKIQVDFIYVPIEVFDFAWRYFNYNDLGNLIGKIAHALGFKFGQNGLTYVVREGNRVISEITVTTEFYTALRFLGFSERDCIQHRRYGFKHLENIFEFVARSTYFPYTNFRLETLAHKDRIRDKKRKTYNEFLTWLDTVYTYDRNDTLKSRHAIRKMKFEDAVERFQRFSKDYTNVLYNDLKRKEVKTLFNGTIVSDITGFKGKDLGKFIHYFKAVYKLDENQEVFQDFILSHSPNQIKAIIQKIHKKVYIHPLYQTNSD